SSSPTSRSRSTGSNRRGTTGIWPGVSSGWPGRCWPGSIGSTAERGNRRSACCRTTGRMLEEALPEVVPGVLATCRSYDHPREREAWPEILAGRRDDDDLV